MDKSNRPRRENLIGNENSFLKSSGYDAREKIILLKELAYCAGLGQYGKNSLIINRRFGSDIKIQALFTESRLRYDKPMRPRAYPECKDCNICIDICPQGMIKNYKVVAAEDRCELVVKQAPVIIGRLPKDTHSWERALTRQKVVCRICQSSCPANTQHYLNNRLVAARKEGEAKVSFFLVPELRSSPIRDSKNGKSNLYYQAWPVKIR